MMVEDIIKNRREYNIVREVNIGHYKMTMKLSWLLGNRSPYYSVTGQYFPHLNKKGEIDKRYKATTMGAIGDKFAKHYPIYKDICNFHLRDLDGSPMHVFGNGMYWLGYDNNGEISPYKDKEKDAITIASKHFMVDKETINEWLSAMENMNAEERVTFVNEKIAEVKPIWESKSRKLLAKYFDITEADFEAIKQKMINNEIR